MKIVEIVHGQNGDGSKSHAPNGTADGQMGDGSNSNAQYNDDEGHKRDDNAKATGSRDLAHDKKGDLILRTMYTLAQIGMPTWAEVT